MNQRSLRWMAPVLMIAGACFGCEKRASLEKRYATAKAQYAKEVAEERRLREAYELVRAEAGTASGSTQGEHQKLPKSGPDCGKGRNRK